MKSPAVLLINDIHVSKDSIEEFEKNWNEALNVCMRNNIRRIVVGGDLWQSRSSQTLSTLMSVRKVIKEAYYNKIYLTLAEGNHDKVDPESFDGYNHVFSEYFGVNVVDVCEVISVSDKCNIYVMSYFPENTTFCKHLNDVVEHLLDPNKYNILYIHEGINGALSTPSDKELSPDIFGDFDKVLVGHYHNRCKIKNTNIEYIGSSRQHNFGEDEEKGYTIVYDDGSHEFVENKENIRYNVIDIAPKDITSSLYNELLDIQEQGVYKVKLRIRCKSTEVSTIDRNKLIESGATKVEFVTEETEISETANLSLEKKFDKTGIKNEYSRFCENKDVDVKLGLSYLDRLN